MVLRHGASGVCNTTMHSVSRMHECTKGLDPLWMHDTLSSRRADKKSSINLLLGMFLVLAHPYRQLTLARSLSRIN
jgi:hypothetical protein